MSNLVQLVQVYERSYRVILMQTEGLSQADSVKQLPFRGNCMNWVLGHIAVHRDKVLGLLGEKPILQPGVRDLYDRGSNPIQEGDPALTLEELLAALEKSQVQLMAALQAASPADLEVAMGEGSQQTKLERIQFLQWHETYHLGQLEILRQLAGKDDTVI
jgi:uncharacterized damage-inducible protein DinB